MVVLHLANFLPSSQCALILRDVQHAYMSDCGQRACLVSGMADVVVR